VPFDNRQPQMSEARPVQPSQAALGTETVVVTALREQHRFHTLTFGGITVVNPLFVLKPGLSGVRSAGDPSPPDVTIGMNVLRKLHLYFAFGERMLYASAAGVQAGTGRDEGKIAP
jgi:hypothetical protein